MGKALRQRIEAIRTNLPPIPGVFAELAQLLHDENVDLRTLGRVIGKDPAMSINVLRIANSAFYGLPNKVRTIEHAVTMLGLREITSVCMACEADVFLSRLPVRKRSISTPSGSIPSPQRCLRGYSLHSFASSRGTRHISRDFCTTSVSSYWTGSSMTCINR